MTSVLTTVLIVVVALVLFLLVIMIHELGHFLFAKLFGVKVNEFAIGMGPTLIKWGKGETKYSLRLLPIGGFCAMEGEDEDSPDERAFNRKKVWKRFIIVVAGAVFNIILGFIFMIILQGQQDYYASRTIANFVPSLVSESDYLADTSGVDYYYSPDGEEKLLLVSDRLYQNKHDEGTISYESIEDPSKGYFYRSSSSGNTGLQLEDQIYSVDGYRAYCFYDAYFAMSVDEDGVMDFVVIRDGEKVTLKNVTFDRTPGTGMLEGTEVTVLDFQVYAVPKTFGTLMQSTFLQSQYFVRSVYVSLWRLVTGRSAFSELSGPVGIASMIGEVAQAGFAESFVAGVMNILYIMALITFNLGIINLLPLPALDGGRLMFLIVEGIRRKPINPKHEGLVHTIGIILLLGLMVIITFQDVLKLITSCT